MKEISRLSILGSTGSIGVSTLDIVRQHPDRYHVHSLSANRNYQLLWEQCREFLPDVVVIVDSLAENSFRELWQKENLPALEHLEILGGPHSLEKIASDTNSDVVMASIVGAAGLPSTLAAAKAGKRVLLANKEALVISGNLLLEAVKGNQAQLLPIDSEHNAVFQCLASNRGDAGGDRTEVKKIILTASGGPFLDFDKESLRSVSPDQACAHPNWEMGRKISVDSATMMNKGLEVIEACLLFDIEPDKVEVVIHPESIIHSMVEYKDGSIIAQMASPDMKIPIAYGLSWPDRIETGVEQLDLVKAAKLRFLAPDMDRFPCLALAYRAIKSGPPAVTALNAANEVAVQNFLEGNIAFTDIPELIEKVLDDTETNSGSDLSNLKNILELDRNARSRAENIVKSLS